MASLMWFRRDLRIADNPALALAASEGEVLPLFVLDQALLAPSGPVRIAALYRSLRALDDQLKGKLVVRRGRPERVLPALAGEIGAGRVHAAADFGPYGNARDERVRGALTDAGIELVQTGSPYAVEPGAVRNQGGGPFQVYSAFYRGWLAHGWPAPGSRSRPRWITADSAAIPADPAGLSGVKLPAVGELAARAAWRRFLADGVGGIDRYSERRDRPDLDHTSRMSVHLKWGTIHPRTLLADLAPRHEVYRKELAWREFYADVLHHRPDSAREYYRPELKALSYVTGATAQARLQAWQAGQTGYPIVDAGMRQLLGEGWMHNRVRMIVASFLVKDLRLEWTAGARHFMSHLVDGDLASNNHGWQWVAGSGTDAAPYFRIFNPTLQGKKFDPQGDYVRRWVPELAHLSAKVIHEPWADPNGAPADYPAPIVDHSTERDASLADYKSLRS